jgi:hypothetical protein
VISENRKKKPNEKKNATCLVASQNDVGRCIFVLALQKFGNNLFMQF